MSNIIHVAKSWLKKFGGKFFENVTRRRREKRKTERKRKR